MNESDMFNEVSGGKEEYADDGPRGGRKRAIFSSFIDVTILAGIYEGVSKNQHKVVGNAACFISQTDTSELAGFECFLISSSATFPNVLTTKRTFVHPIC